jgi:hypothetical protein
VIESSEVFSCQSSGALKVQEDLRVLVREKLKENREMAKKKEAPLEKVRIIGIFAMWTPERQPRPRRSYTTPAASINPGI